MKLKIFTISMVAGMAMLGCTSNKNADGELDSNRVDTTQTTTATSTDTSLSTTDTTTKMPDTIPVDKKN